MLSGQRRLGLEGKLSHPSTYMKPLHWVNSKTYSSGPGYVHLFNAYCAEKQVSPQTKALAAMDKSQKAVSPSVRGQHDASGGGLAIAPRRSSCKCSCTPLPSNFNTVMLHRAILLLFPHGSGPTEFNRITRVEGSLGPCPLTMEPWKHWLWCRLHLRCMLSGWSPHHRSSAASGRWPS